MIPAHAPLSLYIHIPFCREKCAYCAFYSLPQSMYECSLVERFHQNLLEEIRQLCAMRTQPFETVFLGGGNPGILSVQQLCTLLEPIQALGPPCEITMEINPESITAEHEALAGSGLNRISIGIQSLRQQHLDTLGRNAKLEHMVQALDLVGRMRKRTGWRLNCDLMTCIPGQSVTDALDDIDDLVSLAEPDHISLYNLTVEEGTQLARRVGSDALVLLDEDDEEKMLRSCWEHLEVLGFAQYEISNFARSLQSRCIHNERYWNLDDYVGLGPTAAGTIACSDRALRITGAPSVHAYLEGKPFSTYGTEMLHRHEVMEEQLLMSLRTSDGIDKNRWLFRFGVPFDDLFDSQVEALRGGELNLFTDSDARFSLTKEGLMVCDAIILHLSSALRPPS